MFYPPYWGRDHEARHDASEAASKAREAKTEVGALRAEIERLLMITEALWTMVKEQHGYTDEHLIGTIQAIDMRDGKLNGQVAASPPQPCPKCGRTLQKKRPVCLYCGAAVVQDPFQR